MKRMGLAILAFGVAAFAPAQLLNESWRAYGDNGASSYSRPAFVKENRTVFIDQYSFFFRLVCVDAYGVEVWSVPLAKSPTSVRATTDNFIYVTTAGPNPSVLAFSQDGILQWEHVHSSINLNTGLQDTRIIGNDLVIAGVGRTVPISTGERSILICLDRMTGAVKYKREYLINGIPFFGRQMIRSSGGAGFLVGTKSNGTGVMKFDPATGDPLGTYISGPFQARSAEVDSTGQIFVAGFTNESLNNTLFEVRRIDGSGTGLPMIYRKANGTFDVLLSKGSLFGLVRYGIRKMRPTDGATIWERIGPEDLQTPYYEAFRADQYGRIYTIGTQADPIGSWLTLINPDNGMEIEKLRVNDTGTWPRFPELVINSFGEAIVPGMQAQFVYQDAFAVKVFSTPEPVPDTYVVAQGQQLVTNGNGVLSNDKYTNPSMHFVTRVSGPPAGDLQLRSSGEFVFTPNNYEFPIPTGSYVFRYRSNRQGVSRESDVTITVTRGLKAMTLSRPTVAGNSTVSGTVTLTTPGPATTVVLEDDSALLTTPASVAVATNSVTGTFIVTALEVASSTVVQVTSRFETTSRTVNLTLLPLAIANMQGTATVVGGNVAAIDIQLNGRAGPGGAEVTLVDNSPYITVPPSVIVPAGASMATGIIPTTAPPANVFAKVTATIGSSSRSHTIRVTP